MRAILGVASLALVCASGCMSARVANYVGDAPGRRAPSPLPAHLVVNDMTFPRVRMEVVSAAQIGDERQGDVRFDAMEERLVELLSSSSSAERIVRARDLSARGVPGAGYVVQYVVNSHSTDQSADPGGVAAGILGTVLTAGLTGGALVMAANMNIKHIFEVEVRVYRVADSELVSEPSRRTGERVSQFDTSGAAAVFRETYSLEIESGHCIACLPSGVDADRFHREEGRQMARAVYDASMPAAYGAMARDLASAPPPRPEPAPVVAPTPGPTAGGEEPAFDAQVRQRLDERAGRILLCTEQTSGVIVAEWSAPGPVRVTARGVEDEAVQGCVQAAAGELIAPTASGRVMHPVEAPPN